VVFTTRHYGAAGAAASMRTAGTRDRAL
jgi:hypothetical protein